MYTRLTTLFTAMCLTMGAQLMNAQNARVQVIHNSPDAQADSVDIYLNGVLTLDDFPFRSATPFLSLPSGTPQVIGIAPKTSTSYADTLVTYTYTLAPNGTYVVVADGILNAANYSPAPPFDLKLFTLGRESAQTAGNTDVLVHHGSTDAPAVDVEEVSVPAGTIVNNLQYGDFAGYLELANNDYRLVVKDSTSSVSVKAYEAPLASLGLADSAITVVASGFLDPSANNNGPAFGLYVALASGGNLIPLPESKTRAQVIHNSPDAIADSVDVYLNGSLLLDNFAYRSATPFVDLDAEIPVTIGIAPKNSTGYADTLVTFTYTLDAEKKYTIVAGGLIDAAAGYTPFQPFNLEVFDMSREAASQSGNTDVLVQHGSTDAPAVDVIEVGAGAGTIVNNLDYTDFAGYLELGTADYRLVVADSTGSTRVKAYEAPLASLGLADSAITVIASGFLDPAANNNGSAFGLFVALPTGGNLIPLPESQTRAQVIHNSPDAAATNVDIYLNGELLLDDFAFRTATPFVDLNAEVPVIIGVAPGNSSSYADTLVTFTYTLDAERAYIIVADGLIDANAGYTPFRGFELNVYDMAREQATTAGNTDILVHHGSTDAPTVDIVESSIGIGTLLDDVAYADFAGYLEVSTADYILSVTDSTGNNTVETYDVPLSSLSLRDSAITVVASGFLDPANNNNGPAFGLWVALPGGGNLIPLLPTIGLEESSTVEFDVFPNPAEDYLNLRGLEGNWKYQVISLTGQVVGTGELATANTIDVRSLKNGSYLLLLEQDGQIRSFKFSK